MIGLLGHIQSSTARLFDCTWKVSNSLLSVSSLGPFRDSETNIFSNGMQQCESQQLNIPFDYDITCFICEALLQNEEFTGQDFILM